MALEPGARLGRFEIVSPLGKGGMGEVYRARDTRLGRDVAIKVLPAELSEDETYRQRLEREAKTISQLQHPNVCMLYDIGSEGATQYLVMEYLQGETLEDRLRKGALPIEDVLRIGSEIAEAVEAAHRRGVVHRDLKPGNVMLTKTGTKVLDFGLAREIASPGATVNTQAATVPAITREGALVGTMPYMAPEQLEGGQADSRSDIWALGCVLYEMATGERPFSGETEASLIGAILRDEPEPPSRKQALAPERLDEILKRCLQKDPGRRWQSARDVALELESLGAGSPGATLMRSGKLWIAAAVVAVALVAGLAFLRSPPDSDRRAGSTESSVSGAGAAATAPQTTMILVLPFENLGSAENASFAPGVTEEIRTGLGGIQGVSVIARASSDEAAARSLSISEIGTQLGAHYVLDGTVQWASDHQVRIRPELVRVSDGAQIWRGNFDEVIDDLFAVQAAISAEVARSLHFPLLRAGVSTGSHRPVSPAAVRAYLRGHELLADDVLRIDEVVDSFQTAVDLDADFVRAWAALARNQSLAYVFNMDPPAVRAARLPAAREAANRAVQLDPDLPETHRALAHVSWAEGDLAAAARGFEAAMASGLGADPPTLASYSAVAGRAGDFDAWLEINLRTLKLDPLNDVWAGYVAQALLFQRRYEEAERYADRAIEMSGQTAGWVVKAWNQWVWKGGGAIELDAWPQTEPPTFNIVRFHGLVAQSRFDDARRLIGALPTQGYVNQFGLRPVSFLHAQVAEAEGNLLGARSSFEEARVDLEQRREAEPADGRVLTTLGLACAKLGRPEEAVRHGERGVELSGPPLDAYTGPSRVYDLAATYALVGDSERSLGRLEWLLGNPTQFSVPIVAGDADFESLRELPRYREILSTYR